MLSSKCSKSVSEPCHQSEPRHQFCRQKLKILKICLFKFWSFRTHTGIVLSLVVGLSRVWSCCVGLVIEFVLRCMQIVILGLYTVVAHLTRFFPKLISKKIKLMSFELKEGEIPPYSELAHGLEQVLGCIQQLEAAVHLEN